MDRRLRSRLVILCLLLALLSPQPALWSQQTAVAQSGPDPARAVTAVAFSSDGLTLASGYGNGDIVLWDVKERSERLTIKSHHGLAVTGLQFSPDGSSLASAGRDSVVQIWDVPAGTERFALHGHAQPATGLAFNADGTILASVGEDTRVLEWNAQEGTLLDALTGHTDFATSIAFSPDSSTIATSSADGQIRLWNSATGATEDVLLGHSGSVNSVAFSPDGTELVSGGQDTVVRVWDLKTGQQNRALRGAAQPVRDVTVRPNGNDIVAVGEDTQTIVWDARTGSLRAKFSRSPDIVTAVDYSPDGLMLAIGIRNGLVQVLDAQTGRVIAALMHNINALNGAAAQQSDQATASDDASRSLDQASLTSGPGGPILVIRSPSNPFGNYYGEILRAEGFNAFQIIDIGNVSAATLAAYDVAILGEMTLTAAQVTTLTSWVNDGGNLIAMRPDKQLAPLLGLTTTTNTLANAYLLVNTSTAPGTGIVGETIQFHGVADRYGLGSATSVATLYSNATTATANPAVTMRAVGTTGGNAAAFTYDLAKSVAQTRQGNPAWNAQERDGFNPRRSDDMFFGNAGGDPQPDWINFAKVRIPQADEQQRLLANMILHLNVDKKPLPRFWYFPSDHMAVVVMTGDDHGNNGTAGQFNTFANASPPGCSVEDWECVRATSYIFPNTPLSNSAAAAYVAQGFEIGLHVDTFCQNYSPASIQSTYTDQLNDWSNKYTSLPSPQTNRTHCIAWSDWASQANAELDHGIRLDTNYYYWPPGWVADRPGFFTGSGMPMRFVAFDGGLIDVYHAVTQITDESGQSQPFNIDTLLDGALGPNGYYGVFTINAHTDTPQSDVADAVLESALERGVPVVSAKQMLTWLDARNNSSFGSIAWNGSSLSFSITQDPNARGLRAMLPRQAANGVLQSLTLNGSPVNFDVTGIKGVTYAVFPGSAGNYVATYGADTTPPTVTSTSPAANATGVVVGSDVTATFSEAMDPTTITTTSFTLKNGAGNAVSASVTYDATTRRAVLDPSGALAASTTYTATVLSGTGGAKDLAGNALASDFTWTFTTASGPACPCTLWPSSTTPGTITNNDPNPVELGVKFTSDTDGFITGIRYYKGPQNTGTHTGSLWSLSGQLLARATFSGESGSGWQQVNFGTPVAVTAGTVYVASYHTTAGFYSANVNYFANSGLDRAPLHAFQDGDEGGNGVYRYSGSPAFPNLTWNATNYWVDAVFVTTAAPDTVPPTVTGTSPAANATGVAAESNVTATFSEAVNSGTVNGTTFVLRDPGGTAIAAAVSYDSASRTATLNPNASLAANTTYTATVLGGANGVKDPAGNALVNNFVWSFTTAGTAPDTTPPTVTGTSPAANATGVAVGANVTATFSEAINQTTLTTTTFALRTSGGAVVPAALSYDATARVATLNPTNDLTAGATYTATVLGGSTGVKDVAGNALASNVVWSFTTAGSGPDTTPPTVTTTSPTANASGVAVGANLTATFSEAMNAGTITTANFTLRDNGGTLIPAAVTYNSTTFVATLNPNADLTAGATFTATITGGTNGVKDVAGNALATDFTWSFTTAAGGGGPTCPCSIWASSATPAKVTENDSDAVELGVKFRADVNGFITGIRFYKGPQNTGTHTGSLWSLTGQLLARATFSGETASGWQQVSFSQPVAVTANTVYVASYHTTSGRYSIDDFYFATTGVDNGPLHALANGVSGGNGVYNYSSTPIFPTQTWESSNYWVDVVFDTTGSALTTVLAASINDAPIVTTAAGDFSTLASENDEGRTLAAVGDVSIWSDSATPALASENDPEAVELGVKFRSDTNGVISGIRFYKGAQNSGTHTGSLWTLGGQLLARATFTGETASGWQQVSFSQPIAITANTVYIASYHTTSGRYAIDEDFFNTGVDSGPLHALADGVNGGNGVYRYSGTPIFPNQTWEASNYWVDVVFNANAAPDTTPPTITGVVPAGNATGVAVGANVTATFSEAINTSTLTTTTFSLRSSGGAVVTATVTYNATSRTATLNPSTDLASNATYTATVMGGTNGVKDAAGNALVNDFVWSFTTAGTAPDTTPPTVTGTSPTTNATGVAVGANVTATFSEAIDQATLTTTTFALRTSGGTVVPASVTYSATTRVATLNPTADLAAGATYTATVLGGSAGVKDVAGNALASNVVWSFTTAGSAPDTTPPTVTATSPAANATGVAVAANVTATFSEAIDQASLTTTSFALRTSGGALVPASVSYNATTRVATLNPTNDLAASATYTATVLGGSAGIKDLAGNALASNVVWSFTTASAGGPCASPANEIVAENCKPGSPESTWDISGNGDSSIQGFATNISVNKGQTVQFKVRTNASNYRLDIYRVGYYGGNGARFVTSVTPSANLPQSQPNCLTQNSTGLVDCGNWAVSASWTPPVDAVSGVYIAKVIRADTGGASHIFFIVRDDSGQSDLLYQTSDTTWQAYNDFGGNSLYSGNTSYPAGRAVKVSYNRPFSTRGANNHDWFFNAEYPMIRWIERNGYDVSYFTDIDADRIGSEIREHKVFMSVGHDEYWSAAQRANVEAARNAGVNLAFFSGNEVYWKVRWEPSIDGSSTNYRTLVTYKEGTDGEFTCGNKCDPVTTTWTGLWRSGCEFTQADGCRPENGLSGQISWYESNSSITVPAADGRMRFWRNTTIASLAANQTATLPAGVLGYEWNYEQSAYASFNPPGRFTLSNTTVDGRTHKLSLYRHSSGALVFGAGTVQWSWGLDANHDGNGPAADVRIQQATVNLFADMGVQPATLQSGLVAASASSDTTAATSAISAPANGATVPVGSPVTISGTAGDVGGVVAGVEVSVDGGTTWRAANGRGTWTFTWTPTSNGTANIRSRAIDDSGNIETPSTGVTVTVGTGGGGGDPGGTDCPCSIWTTTATPAVASENDPAAVELGVKFRVDTNGVITGIRFYKSTQNSGTHTASLWTAGGQLLARATFTGETASGWQQVTFSQPVAVTANTVYVASYHTTSGRYSIDEGYFSTSGTDSGPLHALADGVSGGNGVYNYSSTPVFPTETWNASNYWVDVVFDQNP